MEKQKIIIQSVGPSLSLDYLGFITWIVFMILDYRGDISWLKEAGAAPAHFWTWFPLWIIPAIDLAIIILILIIIGIAALIGLGLRRKD